MLLLFLLPAFPVSLCSLSSFFCSRFILPPFFPTSPSFFPIPYSTSCISFFFFPFIIILTPLFLPFSSDPSFLFYPLLFPFSSSSFPFLPSLFLSYPLSSFFFYFSPSPPSLYLVFLPSSLPPYPPFPFFFLFLLSLPPFSPSFPFLFPFFFFPFLFLFPPSSLPFPLSLPFFLVIFKIFPMKAFRGAVYLRLLRHCNVSTW